MSVSILGVRHHSPACARLVGRHIRERRPRYVLIEGPRDFNARLRELALGHRLPIAIYSFHAGEHGMAECWFPLLEYSPEWVALREGTAAGAEVRFIDLPHWQYRAVSRETRGPRPGRGRYETTVAALRRRFGFDGDDLLWDHLFEAAPEDELPARLDAYFNELRGDDAAGDVDAAREACMASYIAWAARNGDVLVVTGGWHKRALEQMWHALDVAEEPPAPDAPEGQAGSYLIPMEYRQVDALGGYASGMQSPKFYEWCWQEGGARAIERGMRAIVEGLRARRVPVSTADAIAMHAHLEGLARLRGHAIAQRGDLLDAVLAATVREAMDAPPPWAEGGHLRPDSHPILREAMIALTGDGAGQLASDSPLPPLVHDVERLLAAHDLVPANPARQLTLDRREPQQGARAQVLWRLKLLDVDAARLKEVRSPGAARALPEALLFEEHWQLAKTSTFLAQLIQASAWGASLEHAARAKLVDGLGRAQSSAEGLATTLTQAVRAGYDDLGGEVAARLAAIVSTLHDHGDVARGGRALLEVARLGFWGAQVREMLSTPLALLADRTLWILEALSGRPSIDDDAAAVGFIAATLQAGFEDVDREAALATLARVARRTTAPPALRGACAGALLALGRTEVDATALTRSMAPRTELGDFLFGLFSAAREETTRTPELVAAVHAAIDALASEEFLGALPSLRGAFSWFPPRERAAIARQVAALLGLARGAEANLLTLEAGADAHVAARRIEALAVDWGRRNRIFE